MRSLLSAKIVSSISLIFETGMGLSIENCKPSIFLMNFLNLVHTFAGWCVSHLESLKISNINSFDSFIIGSMNPIGSKTWPIIEIISRLVKTDFWSFTDGNRTSRVSFVRFHKYPSIFWTESFAQSSFGIFSIPGAFVWKSRIFIWYFVKKSLTSLYISGNSVGSLNEQK